MEIKIITENRKARHDYLIIETFEAGLVLMGSEVKSCRNGQVQLKDSYVSFIGAEAFLQNAHISEYRPSGLSNHQPERLRKLLLHKHEVVKLIGQIQEKGLTCIPLKLYFKKGRVKAELAVAKGRKNIDKRELVKTRDVNRELARAHRRSRS